MNDDSWRGHDLSARKGKITRTYNLEAVTKPDDIPVVVNYPPYFAFGDISMPGTYFTDSSVMVEYQAMGYEQHLKKASDDFVPYFMPWFGTGVLASAFGCDITEPEPGKDPAVAGPCLRTTADIAKLRIPDPTKDGWMPRVLGAIDYAREHSDLSPGLTDMQGPLDTAGLMCGHENLFTWAYEDPEAIDDLFGILTEALIDWVKVQKEHIGEPLDQSNGLQGVWSPKGVGIWLSEDDLVMASPDVFEQFAVPQISRIFEAFGGGSLHYCGRGTQHLSSFHKIKNLRVISNSPMGDFDSFAALHKQFGGQTTLHIQDIAPANVETYYKGLFQRIDDLRGVMLTPFVINGVAMDNAGACASIERDSFETINRVVDAVRESASERLSGH